MKFWVTMQQEVQVVVDADNEYMAAIVAAERNEGKVTRVKQFRSPRKEQAPSNNGSVKKRQWSEEQRAKFMASMAKKKKG